MGRLNVLTIATAFLYLIVIAALVYVFVSAATTHTALCNLRSDLQARADSTRDYLHKHPEGFPGVSAATLQQQVDSQQRTIDSLSILNCD
jgi:hypothetical protein